MVVQNIQFKIAEMTTNLTASRLMVRHAAASLDAQVPNIAAVCAMAKLFATDHCYQVLQLFFFPP